MSTTFVKFEKTHGTLDKEWKKNPPLWPTIIICRFERSCGTFRGGGGKNLVLLTIVSQFAQKYYIYIYNNNDHGVDVSIVMVT